jgi:hypothetical protein
MIGHTGCRYCPASVAVDQFDEATRRFPEESTALLTAIMDVSASRRREPRIDVLITATSEVLDVLLDDPRAGHRLGGRVAVVVTLGMQALRAAAELPLTPTGMPVYQDGLTVRLSDGSIVPGSGFTVGSNTNLTTWSISLAIDNSGRFLAVLQSSAVEIWDLDSHKLQARLPTPEGASVTDMQFLADPNKLEITMASSGTNDNVQVEIWTCNLLFGIPHWLGFGDSEVRVITDPSPVQLAEDYTTGNYYTLQSTDPQEWLIQVCGISYYNALDQNYPNVPVNAWSGPLCPSHH